MTSLLGDISPWEGHIVPGTINPLFRQGATVNPRHQRISDVAAPAQQIQPQKGLGDENVLVKQLVKVLQKTQMQSKITEALPQYRAT